MAGPSLYWHDYETFGIDPRLDRPSQFAGVRTDADLNIIDDPLIIYCKPPADYLPQPEACCFTGISPVYAETHGITEAEFCRQIHQQLAQPNTCGLGYNSIRFDDEFTRHCLYRNFYDPYAREWQNGNCRWDLIDVVRAARALRPDGVNWPLDEEGRPYFKLEEITKANGISHEAAHDALSDVHATIGVAKLIKTAQPRLFEFLWRNKGKTEVNKLLQLGSYTPLVHVSGRFAAAKNCLAVVLPLCRHPSNNNGVIVYDLAVAPEPLLTLTAEEIKKRIFTAVADLPEGIDRIPLKTVHANKCPVLAPVSVLRPEDQQRLEIDLDVCLLNLEKLKKNPGIGEKISAAFFADQSLAEPEHDPDLMLYSGFFPDRDRYRMQAIPAMTGNQLAEYKPEFIDARLDEMFFRYRARNYPDTLSKEEQIKWQNFTLNKLNNNGRRYFTFDAYELELARLKQQEHINLTLIAELESFVSEKKKNLSRQLLFS